MADATRLLIKNGTLIDGSGDKPVPNKLLVVEGNRITLVGGTEGSTRPETPDDRVIDATGKFILPGLIDAHCHISLHQGALPGMKYTSTAEFCSLWRIPLHQPPVPIFWRGCRRARLPHRARPLHKTGATGRTVLMPSKPTSSASDARRPRSAPASCRGQGGRLRLRRHLYRTMCARNLCRGVRQTRRSGLSSRCAAPNFPGCRPTALG